MWGRGEERKSREECAWAAGVLGRHPGQHDRDRPVRRRSCPRRRRAVAFPEYATYEKKKVEATFPQVAEPLDGPFCRELADIAPAKERISNGHKHADVALLAEPPRRRRVLTDQ
jgi:hypothetical protein